MTMHCPECQAELEHKSFKVFHCWMCPENHGTFYPRGELEQIVKTLSGLGDLEFKIWSDKDHYSVIESTLYSPEGNREMLEIRDKSHMNIILYGDPETHSLWMHTGEEEKLMELLQREAEVDSVGAYVKLAAAKGAEVLFDEEPTPGQGGEFVTALKLLGDRVIRAMPHITL